MTNFPDLFAALAAPFRPDEIKTRVGGGGRQLHYITARTAMNRLDEVLGPESWSDEFHAAGEHSILCKLTIRLPDGSTVTKCDAGGYAGMSDQGDDDKSGHSDAFKRAAAKFGVGRYLYRDGVPSFADDHQAQQHTSRPEPAQPPLRQPPPPRQQANPQSFKVPQAGRPVYGWAKDMEAHFRTSVINGMKAKGKEKGYQTMMTDWTQPQVDDICGGVIEYLKGIEAYQGEFDALSSGASPVPRSSSGSDLPAARKMLLDSATSLCRQTYDREPSPEEVKRVIGKLSVDAANRDGHQGEVMESLKGCDDKVWIDNTIVRVCDRINDVMRIKNEGGTVMDPAEEADDIPF